MITMHDFDTDTSPATVRQLDEMLAVLLTTSTDGPLLSDADTWLHSVLLNEPAWAVAWRAMPTPANGPSPALLIGLLLVKRNALASADSQPMVHQADDYLYDWLMHWLTSTPAAMPSGCALAVHYLIISLCQLPVADGRMAKLLRLLQHQHPAGSWNPGLDLTTEIGATGWLLTLLKARSYCLTADQRIARDVSDLDPYLEAYVRFLYTHQIPATGGFEFSSLFPVSVRHEEWNQADEQSWSQGDLGHLLLLHEVAGLQHQDQLTEWANRIGGYLMHQRQQGRLTQKQPGLLNGMAGLSLLYRRLHGLTQQQAYLAEAHYWLGEVMQALQQGALPADGSFRSGRLGIICALKHWLGQEAGLDLLHL
ncbi:hypothetical protein [Fibrella aquatilis]|uniref:Lanthionine synthetase C-like protein n=1 Tax=Fibrella aquatilis TaxID=2817059 RepID=A0A939K264_9BACT|nr:hypothetical protein [Fibrella aquatilis]MBO0932980.1 hypothetical protein [Fibrella aquatilis]